MSTSDLREGSRDAATHANSRNRDGSRDSSLTDDTGGMTVSLGGGGKRKARSRGLSNINPKFTQEVGGYKVDT